MGQEADNNEKSTLLWELTDETTMNHMMTITTDKKPTVKKKANLLLGNSDETTMNHITINIALQPRSCQQWDKVMKLQWTTWQ